MGSAEGTRSALDFQMLGPLRVLVDGQEVPIATRRQRALLVLLLMSVGRVVPTERLIEQLWDGEPPPQGAVTLRSYVSNLRQALGGREGTGSVLATRGSGYVLDVPADSVDAVRMGRLAEQGREHLRQGRSVDALAAFDTAVGLWSGDPLAEIADHEAAQSTITQLTETYLGAVEGRFEALLSTGRHLDAIPLMEAFATNHPLREAPRAQLMLALYRAGRAPEALEVHRRFRALLRDELGIDPSARLEQLTQRILEQDPGLDGAPPSVPEAAPRVPSPGGPGSRPARPAPPAPRAGRGIVGRNRELTTLRSHLDRLVTDGSGALVLLAGEPGIGKTTLIDAIEQDARDRGVAVHAGRAPAASGAPAFWPWSQVVESLAEGLDEDQLRRATAGSARPVAQLSQLLAERAGQLVPMTGDNPQTLRFLLYEAVSSFIRQATESAPVVITLDDIHWADVPSLELLSYLTPSLSARPVLVVAAYRDLPVDRTEGLDATLATVSREDIVEEVALAGLDPTDVALLTDDLLGTDNDTETRSRFVTLLHERTGGNPFFVRQLARLIVDAESYVTDPSDTPVPAGVRHVISSRLHGLPPAVDSLLAAGAVIGREFDLRTAAAAAGLPLDEALEAYDQAAQHGLVEGEAGSRRFVHALVQEAVLDALPTGRSARLHADVAARLERDGTATPDELARHLWAARDLVGAAAVPALMSAAGSAASVFAHEQAEEHLRRALTLVRTAVPPEPGMELTVLLSLFRLIVTARGWGHSDARAVVDRAMDLAEAGTYDDQSARLWWSLFFFLLDRDDKSYVEVASTLLSSFADLPPTVGPGPAARAAVHLQNIFSALARDDRETAEDHLRTARALIDVAPIADLAAYDEHLHVMLLLIEGYWAALHDDLAGYRSATEAAIALAEADGRPFPRAVARTLAAVAAAPYLYDPAYVHEYASAALDLDNRFGYAWLGAVAEATDAYATGLLRGTPADAVETLTRMLESVEAAGRRGNVGVLLLMLADLYAADGRDDDARKALHRAREEPGPYQGLVIDVIDRKLSHLAR